MNVTGIPKKVSFIQFAMLSPDEIRGMSATKIITADTYDDDGFPISLGLMDQHLGVIEPGLRCKTCGRKVNECPGHFGHIDLAMPIIMVGFVKIIKNMLKSTCRKCGRILLSDEQIEFYKSHLLIPEGGTPFEAPNYSQTAKTAIKDASSTKNCPRCGEVQKKITLDKPTTFREDGHKLTARDVRERLEKIARTEIVDGDVMVVDDLKYPDDIMLMGMNPDVARPEWLVITALPVPPVNVRPSITLESGDRSEDDLTHKMVDIIRINQRLLENRDAGAPQLIVEDLWELLQYHITTYFDNQTSGIPPARHRSGRPLKTLVQRLKGKEGRFRANLSGKRVNFSARTVISPDPYISINDVGLPLSMAKELTVPLRVTDHNIEQMAELVEIGASRYPGVNYVIRPDGRRLKITEKNCELLASELKPGYIIERQLVEGDIVLFNRQPSLHRMSMMGHRVRIMADKTFRINLCVCPPYNADFDGDEMNMHIPQSVEARAEAKILMQVQEHVLSPRFGGPIIGAIHDHISGSYLATVGDKCYNKTQALHILSAVDHREDLPPPAFEEDGVEMWTGKQLYSVLIPEDIYMFYKASVCKNCDECVGEKMTEKGLEIYKKQKKKKSKAKEEIYREMSNAVKDMCPEDAYVWIFDGHILAGTIDENSIGAFKGKLIDRVSRELGVDAAREFLDNITKLAVYAVTTIGFSTGIEEEDIPPDAIRDIDNIGADAVKKVDELVNEYNSGKMEPEPGRSLEDTLEMRVMRVLGQARDGAGEIAGNYLGLENSAVIMAKSGARGSMLNLSQMSGLIGQQSVRGERINRGYQTRTLPHFRKHELGAEAKGFVKSSYKTGMTPIEYFFHAIGGREGLVDTAVRTSRSGYMQRRLINALEDLKVVKDGSVRNTADTVIQFNYGGDRIDPAKSERGIPINVDNAILHVIGHDRGIEESEMEDISASFGTIEQDMLGMEEEESEYEFSEESSDRL